MIETQNPSYGFWGTMNLEGKAVAAWALAMRAISRATGLEPVLVRAFLDSAWGRHFADTVYDRLCSGRNLSKAIEEAVDRWQSWPVSRATRREYDIPPGTPYLTGFVVIAAGAAGEI